MRRQAGVEVCRDQGREVVGRWIACARGRRGLYVRNAVDGLRRICSTEPSSSISATHKPSVSIATASGEFLPLNNVYYGNGRTDTPYTTACRLGALLTWSSKLHQKSLVHSKHYIMPHETPWSRLPCAWQVPSVHGSSHIFPPSPISTGYL